MTDLRTLDERPPADVALLGGKARSLAFLTSAGFPVPPGFCLTTTAHRRLRGRSLADDCALVAAIAQEWGKLGPGPVAVRSSATAEDGAVTSFAGQQETVLGVVGLDAVVAAIERCWASLDGARAVAYRRQQGLGDDHAMAVVVQRLILADVAGVLFTRDPLDPSENRMLVEASWGLGETVVSGRVAPDRFHLGRDGVVVERYVATKTLMRTADGEEAVPPEKQVVPCLDDNQLSQLADLGRRVEAFHGEPRDIEFALAGGTFWLLQSRPITTGGQAEREQVRREEIAALRARAEPRGTVWSRFNLAEVLPAPTPMTWAVVSRHLMSATGGLGLMYRDLGFDPDPSLTDGVFDLVCGRPYCNLSREPRLHYRGVLFEHPFAALKADPRRAVYPTPTLNLARFPWHFWATLPVGAARLGWRLLRGAARRRRLGKTFARHFREEVAPAFLEAALAGRQDLTSLDDAAVVAEFEAWTHRTLRAFARDSLKPAALGALAMADLERKLAEVLGVEGASSLVRDLVMGVRPPEDADLAAGIRDLVSGQLTREAFLDRFGHRAGEEMELSRPRWSEDPSALPSPGSSPAPQESVSTEDRLRREPRLNAEQCALVLADVAPLHEYLGLRDAAKHFLMRGYALIRAPLVELDRRHRLNGGLFYLTPEELPALLKGEDVSARIAERRRRRTLALGLEVPPVLFSDDLDAIGRPVALDGAKVLRGMPLSAGVAEGPALVLEHPCSSSCEGYILVCPSTDPAWVPLFTRARGLVMETGGVLSHGAIVAREFGLPAVAGPPGVLRAIRTGQRVRVDGGQGVVAILD
jgi:rifampicin phosphotransferase